MLFCMSSSFLSYEKKEKRMYVYFPSIDEKINLMQCVFKQETDKFFPLTGIKKKKSIPTTDKIDICSSNKEQKKCSCTNIYESACCISITFNNCCTLEKKNCFSHQLKTKNNCSFVTST